MLIAAVILALVLLWLAAGFYGLRTAMHARGNARCFLAGHGHIFDWTEPIRPRLEAAVSRFETEAHERRTITADDGTTLAAELYPQTGARGIVLAFHGYASCPENDFCCALGIYLDAGWSVLLVHERACNDSGGEYMTLGVREREDAVRWANEIAREYPHLPIVLAGVSMGATAVMTATELSLPDSVCGIIADCGFESPRLALLVRAKRRYGMLAPLIVAGADIWSRILLGFPLDAISTVRAMKKCRLPALFMHGEADNLVPMQHMVRAYEACASEYKRFITVKDAPHIACVPMGGEKAADAVRELLQTAERAFADAQ